ncbi:S-layer homology domain-containing protein [Bacillus cihuensis]|uniref:S-layer homology domain-containing protein n=1 Tax=Bacillus cihuensis TaxID=1208599 RepID=UPI000416622F|nr:S-layer homology domain-containing protein [Bacillus cihuensis]
MKKVMGILLSLLLVVSFLPINQAKAADDLTNHSLEFEMREMIKQGVLYGYKNGKYAPNEDVSRAQFAAFISRALKLTGGTTQFSDVPANAPLASEINAAVEAGIITGYQNGKFGPNDTITREQAANMIDKSLSFLKVPREKGSLNFTDADLITSSISRAAIASMVSQNIILGIPNYTNTKPNGSFRFDPKGTTTRAQAAAFIYRMLTAAENYENETDPEPSPGQDSFKIATIDAKGSITEGTKNYSTLDEADRAITNNANQVITYNGKIVKMTNGIVVASPSVEQNTTIIYESNLKTIIMPVDAGANGSPPTELEYVTSDESKITVKVAGRTGYVKHNNAYLLPSQMVGDNLSYYSVNANRELVHYIYDNNKKSYVSYATGVAPSFLKAGVKYISWDGNTFKTTSGTVVGTAYQYFNMLSVRAETKYTAAELDAFITQRLAELEALYVSDPKKYVNFKDATKISKLIGIGSQLKEIEKTYHINALLILGMAIHESNYGLSPHAQNSNNLFGIRVFDSNPLDGEKYASVYDSMLSLVTNYLNKNYVPIPENGNILYHNGASPGNKFRGINVRYASDPYWGQKVAGHMYRIDQALGGKDFINNPTPYTIGLTAQWVNVREGAGTSFAMQFKYPSEGYPLIIVGTVNTNWYKVLSDSNNAEFSYLHTDYVNKVNIAK